MEAVASIGKVKTSWLDGKLFVECVGKEHDVVCATFPSSQYVNKLEFKVHDRQNVLGKKSLPLLVRGLLICWKGDWDEDTIKLLEWELFWIHELRISALSSSEVPLYGKNPTTKLH